MGVRSSLGTGLGGLCHVVGAALGGGSRRPGTRQLGGNPRHGAAGHARKTSQPRSTSSWSMTSPTPAFPGHTLSSGIETVVLASANGGFTLSFPAAIPTHMTLTTPAGTPLNLAENTDRNPIGPLTGQFTLNFVPETGVGLRADYYDVYLRRIIGEVLAAVPDRIYTVTAPEVKIDASLLASGIDYVFEIRSYAGHPMAPHGDFAPVEYPYGSAVVFTSTFKTP